MLKLRIATTAAIAALTLTATLAPAHADDQTGWQPLETTAARADNPLKGFIPFEYQAGNHKSEFSHTMEFFYLPLKAVVTGEGSYDWSQFETELEAISSRGHQAAFRFYLDHPGRQTGVPDYLLGPGGIDQSRKYTAYNNNNVSFSPDYSDPRIQSLMKNFVAALGKKYDGDPRIGFITTGLIGFWGEQHTTPMNGRVSADNPNGENWMPPRDVELSVYRAWDQAFNATKLLNRSPAKDLSDMNVGFHDDSFAYSTLPTAAWHFLSYMQEAGLSNRWQTEAIGGEIQPPVQMCVFDESVPCEEGKQAENFDEALQGTHASWLMVRRAWDPGVYRSRTGKAKAAHASLGYDFAATESPDPKHQRHNHSLTENHQPRRRTLLLQLARRILHPGRQRHSSSNTESRCKPAQSSARPDRRADRRPPHGRRNSRSADPQRHARRRPHQIRQHHTRHHPPRLPHPRNHQDEPDTSRDLIGIVGPTVTRPEFSHRPTEHPGPRQSLSFFVLARGFVGVG